MEKKQTGQSKVIKWTVLESADDVARGVVDRISEAAAVAIQERDCFSIVLAGGTTPAMAYRMLAGTQQDWSAWRVFLGDERCLPVDHPERNSTLIRQALLDCVSIPQDHVYMIPAELGAEQAAGDYAAIVESHLPFDMVLLGMGEDGHTASLFPGHRHDAGQLVHAVHHAPKPPADRVSLSARALGRCRNLVYIVTGSAKQWAIRQWRQGELLPVNSIRPMAVAEVLLDAAASGDPGPA